MTLPSALRLACLAGALGFALQAHADSFVSSASSAGSASSGSVSDSFGASSNSSNRDRKVADGNYRILQIAQAPNRAGIARITLQADQPGQPDQAQQSQQLVLDLPQATFDQQQLAQGDLVQARNRVYGVEFARADTRAAFYLVLADEWYGELASRPVSL